MFITNNWAVCFLCERLRILIQEARFYVCGTTVLAQSGFSTHLVYVPCHCSLSHFICPANHCDLLQRNLVSARHRRKLQLIPGIMRINVRWLLVIILLLVFSLPVEKLKKKNHTFEIGIKLEKRISVALLQHVWSHVSLSTAELRLIL